MADFESIIKKHAAEDGTIHAEAIGSLVKAISTAVGNEFVEKQRYKDKLEEIESLKTEKQTAEDSATTAGKWKDKHDAIKKEFEDYKAGVTAKETKYAKEAAARAYYESKGITGKSLDIAMRGSGSEIEALVLEDGKIKDASALDGLVSGDFAALISGSKENVKVNLGGSLGGGSPTMTKDEIMNIKDAGERQRAIAENHELFGI